MRRWWSQLWCFHYHWDKGIITNIEYGKGFEHEYICRECGKKVRRYDHEPPISYIGEWNNE